MNSNHNKNSTLAGMAEASQLHTFVRHPHLSGTSKLICDLYNNVLNIYKLVHAHLMALSSEIWPHNHQHWIRSNHATIFGFPLIAG